MSVELDAIDDLIDQTVREASAIDDMIGRSRQAADTGVGIRLIALKDARNAVVTAKMDVLEARTGRQLGDCPRGTEGCIYGDCSPMSGKSCYGGNAPLHVDM